MTTYILIADNYFSSLAGPPTAGKLPYENSDRYDMLIRGWTRYWNDVLQPRDLLDPDLVKALIGTESSGYQATKTGRHMERLPKGYGFRKESETKEHGEVRS